MPQIKDTHIDAALTQVSVGYKNEEFIGTHLLKEVVVQKQSDKYWVFGQEMFDIVDDRVKPKSVANEVDYDLSTDTYYADGHALRQPVADRERENADSGLDLDVEATENVQNRIYLNREKRIADKLTTLTTYDAALRTTLVGNDQFSDYTNSDPITKIDAAKRLVHKAIGLMPTDMFMGVEVFDKLKWHSKLIEYYKYSQKGVLTIDMLKELFGVKRIHVGNALYNTATKNQTRVNGYIWGKDLGLLYVPDRPAQKTPAFGYSFVWATSKGQNGHVVYRYREESRHSDIVEVENYVDEKTTVQKAGYLFKAAVA
jgi:hypothetical protein